MLLILAVVLIWVGSAEITQIIFEKYRHPFLLTWLGASLLVFYLPLAYMREWAAPCFQKCTTQNDSHNLAHGAPGRQPHPRDKAHKSTESLVQLESAGVVNGPATHAKEVEMVVAMKSTSSSNSSNRARSPRPPPLDDEDAEEGTALLGHVAVVQTKSTEVMSTREIAVIALILAPCWLVTEYLSNAALSMTSVASTTILSSTSGLFTLLFGVTIGGETLTTGKVLAALVSIAGVVMTELGKSSARDDAAVFGDADRNPGETAGDLGLSGHNLIGDMCGLLSAVSYGFYTTLLRKYVGAEGEGGEEKADMQKVFGFIGLFTLIGMWWLVFPLNLIGWEPPPRFPSSYGLDEDILANGLVGSMISDYFWAVSVVWTTPLVATLGLSLTIPLAMVADMAVHGREYSLVYILGAFGVFGGFIVANFGDNWSPSSNCLPSWMRKNNAPLPTPGIDVSGEVVYSDKEFD